MCFRRIGIIGLGLIGGSIAKSVKAKDGTIEIAACDKNLSELEHALQAGVIDRISASVEELANWAELVIIATPLTELSSIAQSLAALLVGHPLTVMDISSVKGQIVPVLEKLSNDRIEFVSTHPMAGKETLGFISSSPTLFEGAAWIITPHRSNKTETLHTIERWIEALNANPIRVSLEKHDEQVALISHLPMLISQALLAFVKQEDAGALEIAGTGFQSMTRLAKTPPQLSNELTENNREILNKYWKKWIEYIQKRSHGNP